MLKKGLINPAKGRNHSTSSHFILGDSLSYLLPSNYLLDLAVESQITGTLFLFKVLEHK